MPQIRATTPDSFDETDGLESLEVELTPKQIEWLRQIADERDLPFDHVLRSVITAQIRAQGDPEQQPPMPQTSGDGQPQSSSSAASLPEEKTEDEATDDESSSIVDSLRSASERLQDLTEQDNTAETPDPHDTLERLQARFGNKPDEESEDASHDTVLIDDQSPSMFDMMEKE